MSDPIVKPDLSEETVGSAVTGVLDAVVNYIPEKVRAAAYSAGITVAAIALVIAPVLGGEVANVIKEVGAVIGLGTNVLAVSHITTKSA